LLRRLLHPSIALLAALLWAGSPFLVAHARLLHLDATVTSLIALSLLALLVAFRADRPQRAMVLLSGELAGLALLTKAPSLTLLPFVGLWLWVWYILRIESTSGLARIAQSLLMALRWYALWLGTALLVVFVAWPAMWVAPLQSVGSVINEVIGNGGEEHHSGNFFWGLAVGDPGPWFYLAVVLWRSMPWTLLGLGALLVARRQIVQLHAPQQRQLAVLTLRTLAVFSGYFLILMSLLPKKFDRYLLPIWPALEILAAAGLVVALLWLGQRFGSVVQRRMQRSGLVLLVVVLSATLGWYHPYYVAAFNPLVGGGTSAEKVMLVGWGEGYEVVGEWLSQRPDLDQGPVLAWIPPSLAPFVPEQTLVRDLRPAYLTQPSSYAVRYVRSVQRQESTIADQFVLQSPALFTVQRFGITYATVHQLPRPFTNAVDARFESGLHLRGYTQAQVGTTLVITPSWSVESEQPGGQFVFVHLLDQSGQRIAQFDAPLDNGDFTAWQVGQQFATRLQLALPADLPAGEYTIALGVYDLNTGARHRLLTGQRLPEQLAGPEALHLATLTR
jgi:4-amino-4-deoxy-L-arabinose transferase-like glycosyltransferase